MDKDLELAITNPVKYLSQGQQAREWDMSIEDIARSIRYNPAETLLTKAQTDPKTYGWVTNFFKSLGRGSSETLETASRAGAASLMEVYSSPNMRKEAAEKLIEDMAYTRFAINQAKRANLDKREVLSAEKYPVMTNLGEGIGQFFTNTVLSMGSPMASWSYLYGSSAGQMEEGLTESYIEKTGGIEGYAKEKPKMDLLVGGYAAFNTLIERGLGAERIVANAFRNPSSVGLKELMKQILSPERITAKQLLKSTAKTIAKKGLPTAAGEASEEFAQEYLGVGTEVLAGYRAAKDLLSVETLKNALTSAAYGGAIGFLAGNGMFYGNRLVAKKAVAKWAKDNQLNLTDTQIGQITNDLIDEVQYSAIDAVTSISELQNQFGQSYDKLKTGIKNTLELQGWSEKMIDPKTGAELSLDEYVDLTVNSQIINTAVREAFNSGITIDEFLDVAQFTAVDNFMVLRPLGTAEEIKARIDEQKAIIARQQDLKKTGAGDDTVLREAKIKKAILEKVRLNKIVNSEIQRVNVEEAKTPENVQEIETANKDVESLNNAPTASEFNAGLDNNLTTAQKTKRLGNAVLKKIFGRDNLGFDSVITLPEYANARTALTNSAERIINFAKKHRTYGIQTDLRSALKAMQTVNQGNFLEHATTPSLDGTDVIAQNAFLYHFLFKDADTTTAFIDAYLERAEASISGETDSKLTKKDLVGQAFKATDNLMQVQAESAGIEYDSIYNEDGSYKDQNVAAVMMSYQNQFADDSQAQVAEEQKEIDAVAEQVVDGTATTGTPESVSENFIQDYGEKIEGAKKDMVPKTEREKTENAVVNLLKRSKFNEVEIFEFNKWAQEQPYELLEKLLSSKVTLYAAVSLDARRFIRDNDLYELSGEERQKRLRDAGVRLFDFYFKKLKGRLGELTVEALDAYVNARKQINFTYQASTRGKLFLWGKKGNGSWLPLIEFATKEEMQAHKDSHSQEDLEKLYTEMTSYKQGERKVIRPRTGIDYRNGKNVTEKEFAEQFGFRGVQFGNYENQQKRQREINNSYDSFMDLATLLNVPPKALSLGGTFGIAFGARGSGSAAAHYEPDLKVINITRDSGAGALAHEWFHALDNYLAQNITNASKGDFLTNVRKRRVYTKNLELNDALADYMWEIGRQKDFQARLRLLGQYWKRDWEVAARIFEQYISAKIAEQNGINDYLASPQDYYLAETPYLKEDEAKNVFPYIEKIVKALKVEEREDGNIVLYQPEQFDLADENARLDDIYPAYEGETINIDGKDHTVYNSNGDRIAKSAEALRNFYKWFGDSKVVDSQGRPLVVYHGTNAEFDKFDKRRQRRYEGRTGFWFSNKENDFGTSVGGTRRVMPVYLNLQNPYIVDAKGSNWYDIEVGTDIYPDIHEAAFGSKFQGKSATADMLSAYAKKAGYDGLVINNIIEGDYKGAVEKQVVNDYVAFEPNQIKSVDNRGTFSEKTGNILYQPGYASMRGELIGGALDADAFEGKGEGTSVWAWGNYLLKSKELDKAHYFDSFNRQGSPKILYEGQKLSNMFMSDTAQYDVLLGLTNEKSKQDILSGLEKTLNARKNEVERKTDYVYTRLENKIPRHKLSEMIQDAYKLIDMAGVFYTKYPENSIAADIQKKYKHKEPNPEGKRFTEEFIDVVESIALSYGGLDNAKIFRDSIKDLEVDIDIFKGMDIKKVSGLTGFTYKDTSVAKAVREPISKHLDTSYDNYLASEVAKQATEVIRDAIIKNKNIGDSLAKAADEEQASLLESAEKQKNRILNEHSFTDEQKKVLDDIFAESVLGGSKALDEESRLKIYDISKDKYTFNDQGKESWKISADLRNKYGFIFKSFESGAQKVKALREVADYFKNAKEEDFVLKSRASMYKFDVPESKYLLDFTKSLDRQSKYVKEALVKLYKETSLGDEPYDAIIKAINPKLPRIYKPREILKEPKSRDDIVQTYDGVIDTFLMNWTKNGLNYAKKELDSLIVRQTDYAQQAKDSIKQLEKEKKTLDATDSRFYSIDKNIESWITFENQHADYRDVAKFVKKKVDKIPDDANIDDYADISYEFKAGETGNALYRSIERSFKLTHNEEDIKLAKSLGAVDKHGDIHAQKAASKLLEKYGIQGVKYYGERDKTGYVTFGKTKPIERLFQGKQANGFFDPELNVILLGKNWNTMTLPHELAHYWLNTLFNVYKRVQSGELKANAEWVQEKKDMFAMLGIDENQQALTAGQQEKFARMTEAYLTGIGVSKEMNQTFKDFFAWVPEKYKSILQLGYLDDQGKLQYPFLDQKAVDFFNRWYENASLPSLPTSPERQRFMNVTGDDDKVEKVSIKEMNDREKEFAQDAEEQQRTDARLYNTLDENMPSDIKPTADAQKVIINERGNFLTTSEAQQAQVAEEPKRRWFERKSRETEIQKAQEYIEKNPEHAKEVIFGDPELIPNDTGVDRATLINTYMALNNITPDNPDWATLHTNIAINQSLAGTQLALSNDKSYGTYLDALREIENVLELKAATNYAGSKQGARERFNADIQRFLDKELPAIFATEPNSKEREAALKAMFEKARTTFSGNTTGSILNQVDLDYAKGQTKKNEAFMRWAINQIKKDAGAKLNNEQQAKLLQISAKAQQAMEDLDNREAGKAVAAAQELRNWQMEKQALMGVSPQKFSLFGDWAPRAMLASFNTLVVANIPSTAMNTVVVNATKTGLFGKNRVSKDLIDSEVKRIKAIYGATGMNLAQMEKPTSPSLLHGEKYSAAGQKWYDPYVILGKEDNFFRVPTFVNTLAQIASTDAQATNRSADDVFREYASINNQSDEAKLARKQALAVANMAVFTQNGALASCLNHIRSELNKLSRVTFGLEPEGFGLGNLIAPFLTTGANIAEMGIRGSLAPITTITTMVNKWRTGKELDPMKKLALRMDWTYFTLSAVSMVLLAALTSDDDDFYTDPYRTGLKYSPDKPYDSINIAGVWLDLDFFGSFAIPMRTAAKVIQAWKKDNGIGNAVMKGYAESAKSVLGDVPLAESVINNQVNWAVRKPGSWASSYLYTQANKLVPAQIKPVSRALSRGEDWIFEPFAGTTVGRKFNRNYGFDGAELTTQDLIELLTIKVQLDQSLNQKL